MSQYKVPKGEEGLFHVQFYQGNRFDPDSGEEIVKLQVFKTNPQQFKSWKETAPKIGIKIVEILHDPTAPKRSSKRSEAKSEA